MVHSTIKAAKSLGKLLGKFDIPEKSFESYKKSP